MLRLCGVHGRLFFFHVETIHKEKSYKLFFFFACVCVCVCTRYIFKTTLIILFGIIELEIFAVVSSSHLSWLKNPSGVTWNPPMLIGANAVLFFISCAVQTEEKPKRVDNLLEIQYSLWARNIHTFQRKSFTHATTRISFVLFRLLFIFLVLYGFVSCPAENVLTEFVYSFSGVERNLNMSFLHEIYAIFRIFMCFFVSSASIFFALSSWSRAFCLVKLKENVKQKHFRFFVFFFLGWKNWTIKVKRKQINKDMACALGILFDDGDNATIEANLYQHKQ